MAAKQMPWPEIDGTPLGFLLADAYRQFFSYIWADASRRRLDELELLVLSTLGVRDGRRLGEFGGIRAVDGDGECADVFNDLCARGLLRIEDSDRPAGKSCDARLFLTPQGRVAVQEFAAISDRIEAELARNIGASEAATVRRVLQNLAAMSETGTFHRR